jgi:hypothetical protein
LRGLRAGSADKNHTRDCCKNRSGVHGLLPCCAGCPAQCYGASVDYWTRSAPAASVRSQSKA